MPKSFVVVVLCVLLSGCYSAKDITGVPVKFGDNVEIVKGFYGGTGQVIGQPYANDSVIKLRMADGEEKSVDSDLVLIRNTDKCGCINCKCKCSSAP